MFKNLRNAALEPKIQKQSVASQIFVRVVSGLIVLAVLGLFDALFG
jgi:hypothetical protein